MEKPDIILKYMEENHIPVTRENYIEINSMGDQDPNEEMDPELEAELPEELQFKNQKPKEENQ